MKRYLLKISKGISVTTGMAGKHTRVLSTGPTCAAHIHIKLKKMSIHAINLNSYLHINICICIHNTILYLIILKNQLHTHTLTKPYQLLAPMCTHPTTNTIVKLQTNNV